jgi:hypothetical protein
MSPYSRPATFKDGFTLISNLRKEDREEVEGIGSSPLHIPFGVLHSEQSVSFFNEEGDLAGIAGVVRLDDSVGQIWMLCTPAIQLNPHTFVRRARKWLSGVEKEYRLLWNLADSRNHMHHKLLKLLGFKALRLVPVGPQNLHYLEIVKLCANQSQHQQQPLLV